MLRQNAEAECGKGKERSMLEEANEINTLYQVKVMIRLILSQWEGYFKNFQK